MLRTPAPLIGALDGRYESSRSLSSPKLKNGLPALPHHAAFEMIFANHFTGARRNGGEGIDKKNEVSWSPEVQSRIFCKKRSARLSFVVHTVIHLGAPDLERSAPHGSDLDQWRTFGTDVGSSGKF